MSSLQQQQQQLAELQQMQMQRQAIANAHSNATGYGGTSTSAGVPSSSMPPYTSQQIAAAAASAGLTGAAPSCANVTGANQSANSANIRTYLDQTVVPILLDGKIKNTSMNLVEQ